MREQAQTHVTQHGVKDRPNSIERENLQIDQEALLLETLAWPNEKKTKYGLTSPNRGQIIKEFLKENGSNDGTTDGKNEISWKRGITTTA